MAFPGREFRKLKNHFAVRAAAQETQFSTGFSYKADSTLRLMYLTAQPHRLEGGTGLGQTHSASGGRLLFNSKALSCGHDGF